MIRDRRKHKPNYSMISARVNARLTQKELAEKAGIAQNTISTWECGLGMPDVWSAVAVCDVLGISLDEYIGRKVNCERRNGE